MASKASLACLECCLCFQIMTEPKQLKCTHSFCMKCLVKYSESTRERNQIPCPLCLEVTPLMNGNVSELQTNVPLKYAIEDGLSGVTLCTMCDEKSQSPAVRFCEECGDFMCEACEYGHGVFTKTARHVTVTAEDATSGKLKVKRKCTKHPNEERDWVCTTCTQSVCLRCRTLYHGGPDHNIEDVSTYIKALTDNIKSLKIDVNAAVDSFQGETQKIVDVDQTKVDPCFEKIFTKINKLYDEKNQKYSEKRGELIDECNTIRDQIKGELHKIRDEREFQLGCITSASDFVENGLETLIEGHARSVHDDVCFRLREDLACVKSKNGIDLKRAKEIVRRVQFLTFTPNKIDAEHVLGVLRYNQFRLEKKNTLSLFKGCCSHSMTATHDGRMIVGYSDGEGGVEVFSVHGSQGRRLQGVLVWRVSVLRDGRSVVLNQYGHISLYTQTWKRIKKAVFEGVETRGGMDVDGSDHIYVGCVDARVVRVFTPEGGPPVREIPCPGYQPFTVCAMNHSKILVLSDGSSVRVVDGEGNVMYMYRKRSITSSRELDAHIALLRDDSILIGWGLTGQLSVDLYTNQLRLVRNVLPDYRVNGYVRSIREFSTGEIAVSYMSKVYIFRKTRVSLTGETSQ